MNATARDGLAAPVGLMVVARIANMAVGLGTIPLLVHYLGGEGFAAWALLLAISAGFSTLELGMSPTYVKHIATPIQSEDWGAAGVVLSHVRAVLAVAYVVAAPLVWIFAAALARRLRIPDANTTTAAEMIGFVFVVVAMRAWLQLGGHTLYAALRFRAVAFAAFVQSLASNVAAAAVAVATRRLDLALAAYWSSQLAVVACTYVYARAHYLRRFRPSALRTADAGRLCAHGLRLQMYEWSQFINFQFDKFLLAWLTGLWAVAPYEVANRGMLALRSIPASGLETVLPRAAMRHDSEDDLWSVYRSTTRLAGLAILIFMVAPIAVAPVFLYAWTGEMGYVGRWAFIALLFGGASNALAIPAASLAQASGQTNLQLRAATVSMLLNVPLSFILVLNWELSGAAIASAITMVTSSAVLILEVHRSHAKAVTGTLRMLGAFVPAAGLCVLLGLFTYAAFASWFEALEPALRYARETRVMPALAAGAVYVVALGCVAATLPEFRGGVVGALRRLLGGSRRGVESRP